MRRLALLILLVASVWVFLRPSFSRADSHFDPLGAAGREVERAVEERRYADALPLAAELRSSHPDDATVAIWLAEIYGGLGQYQQEGDGWSHVLQLTREADASCPAMPEAYARAGQAARALNAYEQCADAAPGDPERWLDLAGAYAAADRPADADRAVSRARELDPQHPYFRRIVAADRQATAHDEGRR